MRIPRSLFAWALVIVSMSSALPSVAADSSSKRGWQNLFDGKTTAGWRGFKKPGFPDKGWRVESGALVHASKGGGGDIISEQKFQEFDLRWEWKVADGANSGLKYFIIEERGSAIGHEYQMIDDALHPDARTGPLHQTAAFYDVLPPHKPAVKPAGEWNRSRILVKGNRVEHYLNGKLALRYEMGSPEVVEGVAKSKFKKVEGFGKPVLGHILLQDHSDEVWFRNIRIKDLAPRR
ncbi:MAG: DUF1080 domain-containing protein [Verrucomicrobiales bacterium]|nr:DUF1080 domain-containing protein [Verrucomicrobiales bacterium]